MQSTDEESPSHPNRIPFWIWLLVFALALALRLPGYLESVWIDELYTSDLFCGQPIVLAKTLYSDIHPPAYFLFIHLWNRVFGDGELWLRLPPLLCGLGSLWLVGRLAQRHLGAQAALAAALLLALSPVHIWYSQEARPYSANVFLSLAALVSLEAWQAAPERRRYGWAFAFTLFGTVFTHYYMAVFPIGFAGLALLRRRGPWRGVLLVCVLVLGCLGVYMGAKLHFSDVPTSKGYLRGFDLLEAWRLGFVWFLTGNSLTPLEVPAGSGGVLLRLLQILAVPVFLRGLWRLVQARAWTLLGALAALPAFLLALNLAGLDQTYIERSVLPALPLFLVVLAGGLVGWQRPRRQALAAGLGAAACALVLGAFFLRRGDWTVYKPNPDWRGAAAWIGERLGDDGELLHLDSDYISPTALTYYDPRLLESKTLERNAGKVQKLLDRAAGLFDPQGFPGAEVQSLLSGQLARYDAYLAGLEAGMRVPIHELRATGAPAVPSKSRRLLLVYGKPSGLARGLLDDPRSRVRSQASFRSLELYELAWD